MSIGLRGEITELITIPALCAALPWPIAYRGLKALSRYRRLFRAVTEAGVTAAESAGMVSDRRVWERHFRLMHLVDYADPWIARTRNDRWMDQHLEVDGAWPRGKGPFLAVGLHWGAGMWVLRHIHHQAGPLSMVLHPEEKWGELSRPMRHYRMACDRQIVRASGSPVTETGSGLRTRVKRLADSGKHLLVLIDVPPVPNRAVESAEFLGHRVRFSSGIVEIAMQCGMQPVPYAMGVDFRSGKRTLRIGSPLQTSSPQEARQQLICYLSRVVAEENSAWHFWPLWEQFVKNN